MRAEAGHGWARGKIKSFLAIVFRTNEGHLRTAFRSTAYLFIAYYLAKLFTLGLRTFLAKESSDDIINLNSIMSQLAMVIALIIASLIILKYLDHRDTRIIGIHPLPGWIREFGLGFGIGSVLLFVSALILWFGGWITWEAGDLTGKVVTGLFQGLLYFILAGMLEELLFRGYLFQAVIEGTQGWIAIILFNLLFVLLHLSEPSFTVISAINIFLGGAMLSIAYLKTRSLWLPIGIHVAWNWTQSSILGAPVSGLHYNQRLLTAQTHGPDWLSGGVYGIEGSFIITILIILVSAGIWRSRLHPGDLIVALLSKYPSGYRKKAIVQKGT